MEIARFEEGADEEGRGLSQNCYFSGLIVSERPKHAFSLSTVGRLADAESAMAHDGRGGKERGYAYVRNALAFPSERRVQHASAAQVISRNGTSW